MLSEFSISGKSDRPIMSDTGSATGAVCDGGLAFGPVRAERDERHGEAVRAEREEGSEHGVDEPRRDARPVSERRSRCRERMRCEFGFRLVDRLRLHCLGLDDRRLDLGRCEVGDALLGASTLSRNGC